MDRFWHFCRVHDSVRPLGDRFDSVNLVVDLVEHATVDADQLFLNLACHHKHRGGGRISCPDPSAGVLEARPWHNERSADAPARAGVTVGHVGRSLLVPSVYEPDSWLIVKTVHHVI